MLNTELLRNRWILAAIAPGMVLLAPVGVLLVLSGFVLGFLVIGTMILFMPAYLLLDAIQRLIRSRSVAALTESTQTVHEIAEGYSVPLVESLRPPRRPVEVLVRQTKGGCPLMRKPGDVWRIDSEGRLSAPMCGPSAAAVQRLLGNGEPDSGTTARCVCPLGPYELTFMLDAA